MPRMIATQIKPSRTILAENLTRILGQRGRGSARRLAEQLGWTESRISQLRQGLAGNPDTATLDAIAEAVGTTAGELLLEN